ncbi:guanine nucleotide binding protein, alpha subunit [Gorgonomyces haynaldii]|nr:guanine nucleotide binding protein, alpha subunit [Gorgonomyces haynaldii]
MARLTPVERRAMRDKHKTIEKYLLDEAKRNDPQQHLNILLLGPADSGKSTVLKQMHILHGQGFPEEYMDMCKTAIQQNIIDGIKQLLLGFKIVGVSHLSRENEKSGKYLIGFSRDRLQNEYTKYCQEVSMMLETLPCKKALRKAELIGIQDTVQFFWSKPQHYLSPGFVPTQEDILMCRMPTEHITDNIFDIHNKKWHIIDVAGHRDKRSRWAPYFEKRLATVIYVLSAASFCQTMEEDPNTNRLQDALKLYESVASNQILQLTTMVVFFNKYDLIEDKLSKHQIKDFFPDFEAPNERKQYLKFVDTKLEHIASKRKLMLFKHKTTAIDTELMAKVIRSVQESVLRQLSRDVGVC